ncbi:ABC transporter ATP-binding protein [Orrella dioscoreae]|uniref:Branched-chain amino acid transport ATP-binding protein LivG (TC 3.A.1.4.1) n=1 Tax=Orrella dioscoreae TaxID=1851544 RepID=A0A1C3K5P0_9BURK|nr:ABC transporter ATP-binding protein [Orrella dioscoreae]SBT26829.1 Branched-chain amino acid transport ATP-binding protein LivG (TC 3.A.1.4.1) [Orrella dioscoreae]SOE52428.1 Branched-chain amino acid transport ATP-binding protein LivG (TC 3.A.1.4.1) [Orrella dioscoreae]
MMEKGLILDKVVRDFGGVRAVDNVSLSLRPGETLAVVGPNGAGKSTLVQLISGVDRPSSGSITLDGRRIDRLPPERIARLGLGRSFQTSRVFPAMTVWDSVLVGTHMQLLSNGKSGLLDPVREAAGAVLSLPFWRRRRAAQEAAAADVLKLFGDRLWPRRDQPAFSLSYANRRRLEIARVLASRPAYLLLDEPTAGMNPTETGEMTELLEQLPKLFPQIGLLVIEHKLSLVRRIADRVIVLNQGKVLVEDTPDHALDHPEVVEAYIGHPREGRKRSNAHLG